MSPHVIQALILRFVYVYSRNKVRLIEVFFWPTMELLVWGFLSQHLKSEAGGQMPYFVPFFLGAVILWDVLFRSQQGVAIAFLEDVWSGNLLNIFASPIRATEYVLATFLAGLIRIALSLTAMIVLALVLYQFNLFELNLSLLPFFANLLAFGWALGMISTALIVRYGKAAETLAWAVPFLVQPFSAVFYPVDSLPDAVQPIAWAIPATHVFEGMRNVFDRDETLSWSSLAAATGLNVLYFAFAAWLFAYVLKRARREGTLTKVTSQ